MADKAEQELREQIDNIMVERTAEHHYELQEVLLALITEREKLAVNKYRDGQMRRTDKAIKHFYKSHNATQEEIDQAIDQLKSKKGEKQ